MKNLLVCIDIGGTSMKAGVCDMEGRITGQEILPIHQEFAALMKEIQAFVKKSERKGRILGIAVSAPGAVDVSTGVIGGKSAVSGIHGPAWIEELQKCFGLPASIENDANCAAMAEVTFGNGRGCKNLAFVVCGTGIGGAVVIDGKICHGSHLYGGEFGCMVMRDDEGKLSTFSLQASTMSLVRRVRKVYPDQEWDGRRVLEEAEKNDSVCRAAVSCFYRKLAEGIYNIQHVYDPERILLAEESAAAKTFRMKCRNIFRILRRRWKKLQGQKLLFRM